MIWIGKLFVGSHHYFDPFALDENVGLQFPGLAEGFIPARLLVLCNRSAYCRLTFRTGAQQLRSEQYSYDRRLPSSHDQRHEELLPALRHAFREVLSWWLRP